jgi:hypothetical protein
MDLGDELLDGGRAERVQWRGDGGQRRGAEVGAKDVVEADDADLVGNRQTRTSQAAQDTDRGMARIITPGRDTACDD